MKKLLIAASLIMMSTLAQSDNFDQEFYNLLNMSQQRQMLNNQNEMLQLERQRQQNEQVEEQQQQLLRQLQTHTHFRAPPAPIIINKGYHNE